MSNLENLIYTCKYGKDRKAYTCNFYFIRLYTSLVTSQSYLTVLSFENPIYKFGIFEPFLTIFYCKNGNNSIYRHFPCVEFCVYTAQKKNLNFITIYRIPRRNTMKLYVGNLGDDGNITSGDLRPLFEQYGTVTECECIKNYA